MTTDLRQTFEYEIGSKKFIIKEMGSEDAVTVFTVITKIVGLPLFKLISAQFDNNNSESALNLDGIDTEGLTEEEIQHLQTLNTISKGINIVSSICNAKNEDAMKEFLTNFKPLEILYMTKTMLKECKTVDVTADGEPITRDLEFDKYFTARKLPQLVKIFLFCIEVNFGNFFGELLPELGILVDHQSQTQQEKE